MINTLRDIGTAVYDAFVFPGTFLVSRIVEHMPGLAAWLNINGGETPIRMTLLLSLTYWFLVIALIALLLRLVRYIERSLGALIRTGIYRMSHFFSGIKTTLVLKLRRFFPQRLRAIADSVPMMDSVPMIEFDDLDMAVLRSVSAKGPGFALSAPDLASRFKLRPSQVQHSLEKLSRNKMLATVIGSTDGYDNYRLTDHGNAYLAMFQRQLSRT
jgi:hypothetical protein